MKKNSNPSPRVLQRTELDSASLTAETIPIPPPAELSNTFWSFEFADTLYYDGR
jgi:hypothetical protein